jgi:signal transduction histidine kinase
VKRTDNLVQGLLTLARMDKGTVTAEMKRFDLSQALLGVALPFESTVFEAGRTLETDVPEGVFIRGDEAMLQQLVLILLSNALKYSNEGGLIRLSLMQKGRGAVITVYNTGAGIAPENLEKIFDRFYREDLSHNSAVAGNGLGLAIARTIAEAHKGHIRAESEQGNSATFIVTLSG